MAKLKISSPWVTFYHEINAMFEYDPDVHVVYDEDKNEVVLYIDDPLKAGAIEEILPNEKQFGNVKLSITVKPANCEGEDYDPLSAELYEKAFDEYEEGAMFECAFNGNGAFSYVHVVNGVFTNPIIYVVFKNKVVQYFNDNLNDPHGLCSTLYQEIAKNIFAPMDGVTYCTDIEEPVYLAGCQTGDGFQVALAGRRNRELF